METLVFIETDFVEHFHAHRRGYYIVGYIILQVVLRLTGVNDVIFYKNVENYERARNAVSAYYPAVRAYVTDVGSAYYPAVRNFLAEFYPASRHYLRNMGWLDKIRSVGWMDVVRLFDVAVFSRPWLGVLAARQFAILRETETEVLCTVLWLFLNLFICEMAPVLIDCLDQGTNNLVRLLMGDFNDAIWRVLYVVFWIHPEEIMQWLDNPDVEEPRSVVEDERREEEAREEAERPEDKPLGHMHMVWVVVKIFSFLMLVAMVVFNFWHFVLDVCKRNDPSYHAFNANWTYYKDELYYNPYARECFFYATMLYTIAVFGVCAYMEVLQADRHWICFADRIWTLPLTRREFHHVKRTMQHNVVLVLSLLVTLILFYQSLVVTCVIVQTEFLGGTPLPTEAPSSLARNLEVIGARFKDRIADFYESGKPGYEAVFVLGQTDHGLVNGTVVYTYPEQVLLPSEVGVQCFFNIVFDYLFIGYHREVRRLINRFV